jgi:MFS family permease
VQWVSVVSAMQELTASEMQARVTSVLESIGAAMPGIGIALGGVIAALVDPRATFLFAGAGVLAIAAIAAFFMGKTWPESREKTGPEDLDAEEEIMVELIPVGGRPPTRTGSDSEVVT